MDDEFLQTLDFVAFDTETTGLWAPANRIVEVGAVRFQLGNDRVKRYQSLVNPERHIPVETVRVHRITDTMVKDAPMIKPVLEQFFDFCGPESILIAHNALFDISFVGCELERVGLPLPKIMVLDTVDIYRQYHPGLDSYSLLSLAQQFRISKSQNHRASDDAALVWKLFTHVSERFPFIRNNQDLRREFTLYSLSDRQEVAKELPDRYSDISVAIKEGLTLEIIYASPRKPPETRIIRPLRLHVLKSAFYIAAYCERAQAERTFRLDRIKSFHLLQ